MLRTNRTPSHVEGGRGGIETREGKRGEGGRNILHVYDCVLEESLEWRKYSHTAVTRLGNNVITTVQQDPSA